MNLTLIATFCQLVTMTCERAVVTSTDMDASLTLQSCSIAEPKIVEWMKYSQYKNWKLTRWGCSIGIVEIERPT